MLRGLRYSLSRGLYLLAISIEVMPYPVKALWRSRERKEVRARGEYLSPPSKRVRTSFRSRRQSRTEFKQLNGAETGWRCVLVASISVLRASGCTSPSALGVTTAIFPRNGLAPESLPRLRRPRYSPRKAFWYQPFPVQLKTKL